MKSTCRLRAVAVRRVLLCLYSLICLCCSTVLAEPIEDGQNDASALRIVTAYVKGEMPTAAELLIKCFRILDEAETWKANITLQAAAPDWPAEETYVGSLLVEERRLRASLRSSADRDRNLCLLVSDKRMVAWLPGDVDGPRARDDAQGDGSRLKRVAGTIKLLGIVGRLPSYPRQLSEIAKTYRFANKGVAEAGTDKAYVLEAAPNQVEETATSRDPSSDGRLLIGISVANSLPTHLIFQSSNGSWRMIKLDSIDLKPTIDEQQFAVKPPDGAIVIDLKADESPTAGLKNPIRFGPESIARGKRLYQADCVVCHSIDGTGRDSDVTDNATDLTDTARWISDGSDAAAFLAIRDGAGDEMPPYKDEYPDEKSIWDLVNYIRSLQKRSDR